ncbi:MAG: peptidylprolyl isomerase [Candidatus Brocadiales bacterium]
MAQAKAGDTVRVHYSGSLEDGEVFDSSLERKPLEFSLGHGMVVPGFENAVIGMDIGETKTVSIPPEGAYGPHFQERTLVVEQSQVPPNIDPQIGMKLQLPSPEGGMSGAVITNVTEDTVTLDMNHPLAGKTLTFEIKLVEIV